jgi:phosphoglycolate phosphatase
MKRLGAYRHVIWDWNGTLLDDVALCVDVMNGLLRPRGLEPLTVARYRDLFDFPVREYYARLGFDFSRESFEEIGTAFIERYESRRAEAMLQADAVRVLRAVQQAGPAQSVLSAYHQRTLEELITGFGIRDCFMGLVGLQDHYAHSKLDNGVRWIRQLTHEPHDVVLIGDSVHDYDVAVAMGVDCLLLTRGHQSEERLHRCPVPVLGSLAELAV